MCAKREIYTPEYSHFFEIEVAKYPKIVSCSMWAMGVPKKGSLPMEPPMERMGDRAIVLPRGVQKVRPSDFDATRPSDFDATLGRWSHPLSLVPASLPASPIGLTQLGCYQASPSNALRSEVGPAECAERLNEKFCLDGCIGGLAEGSFPAFS